MPKIANVIHVDGRPFVELELPSLEENSGVAIYTDKEVEQMLAAAYRRGARWAWENPGSLQFLDKASFDYSDKTINSEK